MTPPANNLGRAAINEKDVFGASKCSVEKLAHGGFENAPCPTSTITESLKTVWRNLTPNESLGR
jgi:hypothetical protein